jgi:hypothetical protein
MISSGSTVIRAEPGSDGCRRSSGCGDCSGERCGLARPVGEAGLHGGPDSPPPPCAVGLLHGCWPRNFGERLDSGCDWACASKRAPGCPVLRAAIWCNQPAPSTRIGRREHVGRQRLFWPAERIAPRMMSGRRRRSPGWQELRAELSTPPRVSFPAGPGMSMPPKHVLLVIRAPVVGASEESWVALQGVGHEYEQMEVFACSESCRRSRSPPGIRALCRCIVVTVAGTLTENSLGPRLLRRWSEVVASRSARSRSTSRARRRQATYVPVPGVGFNNQFIAQGGVLNDPAICSALHENVRRERPSSASLRPGHGDQRRELAHEAELASCSIKISTRYRPARCAPPGEPWTAQAVRRAPFPERRRRPSEDRDFDDMVLGVNRWRCRNRGPTR